ncbi:MAG: putative ABC transporter permease [Oscillospiraceae bacterium]
MILATALELATGVLLERIFRQKWWDYSDEPWNFQGHICLKYSLIWGVLAVICIFFANPLLVRLIGSDPPPGGQSSGVGPLDFADGGLSGVLGRSGASSTAN